jgi:hypothetical protein
MALRSNVCPLASITGSRIRSSVIEHTSARGGSPATPAILVEAILVEAILVEA